MRSIVWGTMVVLAFTSSVDAGEKGEWVSMFDGESLKGWKASCISASCECGGCRSGD